MIAVFSLNALIHSTEFVLQLLQIAGGMFISCLGYQTYFADPAHEAPKVNARRSAFLGGFFSCVTNPKPIVFFVALFPGFISPYISVGFQSLVYGVIFVILDAAFIFGYAMLAMYLVQATIAPQINVDKVSGLGCFWSLKITKTCPLAKRQSVSARALPRLHPANQAVDP